MKKNYLFRTILLIHLSVILSLKSLAVNETLASGSFIINMGVTPQTYNNGLKPYGMVYDMLKNFRVPIKWVISQSKVKDGPDFTYAGVQYKGGTFIIPAEFRTTAVNTAINTWISAGVVGVTTTSAITVDVFKTLLFVPQWTLDKDNGNIAASFFQNAGIPASAHGGSSSSLWKLPSALGTCDDVFVLPHADPTWALHQNLYYWNQTFKGNIWSGCHAVSVLENVTNPGATIQMNFLSNTGLVPFGSHKDGSLPYNYQFPNEPVMQFMSTFDGATDNGSEQIYLPKLAGSWRTGTKLLVFDPTQEDIPVKSPGPAAVCIYGRAYNDTARGYVMYQGGHNLDNGTTAERVAAQRAFFNFSFFTALEKTQLPYIDITQIPGVVKRGDTLQLDYTLPPGYNPANYKTKWYGSCGGYFIPSDTLKVTKYRIPLDPSVNSCVITVRITDACGRENFASKFVYVVSGILQNGWGELTGNRSDNNILLNWNTISEESMDKFIIQRSTDGNVFTDIGTVNATGNSALKIQYNFIDNNINATDYFYRILAVDQLNRTAVSNTIFVADKNKTFSFKVIPNPVTSATSIHLYSDKERRTELVCIGLTGKVLFNSNQQITKGSTIITVPEMKQLLPGIYVLKIQDRKEIFYQKIIVAK